jgi:hypothetical protein
MPVSISMNVQIAIPFLSQMKVIVVCFAPLARLNVRRYRPTKVAAKMIRYVRQLSTRIPYLY